MISTAVLILIVQRVLGSRQFGVVLIVHVIKLAGTPEAVKVTDEGIVEFVLFESVISHFIELFLGFSKES